MKINYDGRVFVGQSNSEGGEVGTHTVFHYHQDGTLLNGDYVGGQIVRGHLIGSVHDDGSLDFCYHHVNVLGEIMAGSCHSEPSRDEDGRLLLDESWRWFTGDRSSGRSKVVEMEEPDHA